MPVAIVGATVNDKPNFMAVAWFSKVNNNPPMMMIGIGKEKYTPGRASRKTWLLALTSRART